MKRLLFLLFFCYVSSLSYAQGSLSSGLVLYLPFNGNTLDLSGNSNHATNYGASLTNDAAGNPNSAYSFNGSSDYMKILNHSTLQCDSQITLCAKVYVKGFYNGLCYNNSIIDKGIKGGSDYIAGWYSLRFTGTSSSCYAGDTNLQNYTGFFYGSYIAPALKSDLPHVLSSSIWDCLVFTFNGDSAKMYVNGVLRHKFKGGSLIGKNIGDVLLGHKDNTSYPFWFKGVMDDVRIYNRALSATEASTYCGFSAPINTVNANFKDSSISCFTKQFTDLSTVSSTALKLWFWDFGDGGTSTLKNPTHSYTLSGTYNVRLIVVDSNGYSDTIIRAITTSKYRFVKASNDTSVCKVAGGVNIPLNAVGGFSYSWSPTSGLSNPAISNPIATITNSIQYIVTGTDGLGCIDKDTVNIMVEEDFANAGADITLCLKSGVEKIKLNGSGGVSYKWSPSTGLSDSLLPDPTATIYAPTYYILTVINSIGCTDDDTVQILIDTSKIRAFPKNIFGCIGQKIQLNTTSAITYEWLPPTGLSNPKIPNPLLIIDSTSQYKVMGTSVHGCTTTDSISIRLKKNVITVLPKSISSCGDEHFELLASGAETYSWYPNRGLNKYDIKNPSLVVSESIRYTVVGSDSNGCVDSALLDVVKFPTPVVKIFNSGEVVSCDNKTTLLSAKGASQYNWSPEYYCDNSGSSSTTVRPVMTTVFSVKGIDSNGCVGEDTATVLYDGNTSVAIPNAFTPNGDGINDRIKPIIICDFQFSEFSIFNRWGNPVFHSQDINSPWDGSSKGIPCNMGTYFYMLKGKNSSGKEILLKGDIVLIR